VYGGTLTANSSFGAEKAETDGPLLAGDWMTP
jgi:hypothetical protein